MAFGAFAPLPLRLGGDSFQGWSPQAHARLCADLVALKRVQPLATWAYTISAGPTITVHAYRGMNGFGSVFAPTSVYNATGDVTFTLSRTFEDPYEIEYPVGIRHAVSLTDGTSGRFSVPLFAGNTVRVRQWNASGDPSEGARTTVIVW